MKREAKKNRLMIGVFTALYVIYAVCLFWFHPFVASAKEPVPGGANNKVSLSSSIISKNGKNKYVEQVTFVAKDDYEIVGFLNDSPSSSGNRFYVTFQLVKGGKNISISVNSEIHLSDYVYYSATYEDGKITKSISETILTADIFKTNYTIMSEVEDEIMSYSISGCKVFSNRDAFNAYVKTGSLDGIIKEPELDKQWYLKDVDYKVEADDSPTSEAGEDATYITFTWSTDNLQEGDLLEIRTHNVLKKIGGDQISGFHDYITRNNGVSAFDGKYRFSQYEATKAWFTTLENKPFIFKSYDTDIYYLRPYRNGKYGGWVKISMKRATPTSSPYIEDIEYGDFDDDGDWITDEKLTEENGGHHGINQDGEVFYPDANNPFEGTNIASIFKYFFDFMKSIPSLLGDLPALVSSICSFLPAWVIGFIALGIVVAIILRVVGR